jgi:sugar fermentation stimulation protein A
MGADARRGAARDLRPVVVPVEAGLRARFVRRYQRFFADVETEAGRVLTVHCANPGSMLGFDRPGAAVRCSTSDDPRRRLRHTLEMMRVGRTWVGLHTGRANRVVERALEAGALPELAGYAALEREVAAGPGARLDFRLAGRARDARAAWVEVKSVTLAQGRLALFPDSVTLRGRRHLETLAVLRRRGARCVLLFLVQRADCDAVAPADAIDPEYGSALRAAARAGVELLALGARVGARAILVERALPVLL